MSQPLTPNNDSQAELYRLCDICLSGIGSDDDYRQLASLLGSDSKALEEYRTFIVDSVNLRLLTMSHLEAMRQPREIIPSAEEIGDQASGGSVDRAGISYVVQTSEVQPSALSPQPSKSPVLGFLNHTNSVLGKPILWSILGVGLAFCMYAALITWGIRDRGPHAPRGGNAGAEGFVATITDSADAQWSTDPSSPLSPVGRGAGGEGADVATGEPLQLTSGLVELKLKQGATLLVEGPARWSIDGNNQATLKQGKLVAKVPQEAIGFTLDTPTAHIVDLGTEFGAEVKASGETHVRVIQGAVETRSTMPGAAPVRLSANQAVRISADGSAPKAVPFDLAPFVRLRERFGKEHPPSPAGRVVLFSDNFNASETRHGINPTEGDLPGRQGGLLRHLTYSELMDAEERRPQLARRPGAADSSVRMRASAGRISPNANFKVQAQGPVKFIVSLDLLPPRASENNPAAGQGWAGLIVGCTTQEVVMAQHGGVGFLMHGNGEFFAFDGTGEGKPRDIFGGSLPPRAGPTKVRVEYVTNGFDRGAPADVEVFLDGVSRMKFQTRAPLLENYLVLQALWGEGEQDVWFDNLMVSSEVDRKEGGKEGE